jgi:hypothetical protein
MGPQIDQGLQPRRGAMSVPFFFLAAYTTDERLIRRELCIRARLQSCRLPRLTNLVILSGASAPLLFRRVVCGGRTRSRRTCCSLEFRLGCRRLATFQTRVRKDLHFGRAVRFRSFSFSTFHESLQPRVSPGLEPRETWGTRRIQGWMQAGLWLTGEYCRQKQSRRMIVTYLSPAVVPVEAGASGKRSHA